MPMPLYMLFSYPESLSKPCYSNCSFWPLLSSKPLLSFRMTPKCQLLGKAWLTWQGQLFSTGCPRDPCLCYVFTTLYCCRDFCVFCFLLLISYFSLYFIPNPCYNVANSKTFAECEGITPNLAKRRNEDGTTFTPQCWPPSSPYN